MKAEVPAPVSTMRRSGCCSSGSRNARKRAASPRMSCSISCQTRGCCAISRAVQCRRAFSSSRRREPKIIHS